MIIQSSIILTSFLIVAGGFVYVISNSSFSVSQDVKTVTSEGLSTSGSSLKQSGKTVGLMCIPASTGCGPHTSLNTIAMPIKVREGGGSVDLSASASSIRLTTNSVHYDNIYSGVVNPENDFLFVADSFNHRVQKFDEFGNHLLSFDDGGGMDRPDGIAVDYAGNIYVAERFDDEITVFDSAGNTILSFGSGTLDRPEGVDVGPSGRIYVADTNDGEVEVFDSGGNLLSTIGAATLNAPSDVAVDKSENIYVTDIGDGDVKVFDSSGNLIRTFGGGTLDSPEGIDVHAGSVYIGDRVIDSILVYDIFGNLDFTFNDGGGLDRPEGVEVDYEGNIYVADSGNHEVLVFDSNGNKIRTIGSGPGGADGQFDRPEDVALQTFDQSSASIVGLAAANNLVTSTLDSTFGATVAQTSAFIYWPVTNSPRNSILDQGEQSVIVIAFASNDRPSSYDKIKTELVVTNSHNLVLERNVPTVASSITNLK